MNIQGRPAKALFLAITLIILPVLLFAQGQIPNDAAPERAPDPTFIVGEPEGQPLSGEALETKTAEVASLLRCPVCQGLSINDSPATMARNMKKQTRDLLAQGYSGEQVLTYFEKAYGEFVRLEPPKRGVNWLVWLSPIAFLVVGFVFIRMVIGKMTGRREDAASEPSLTDLPGRNELPDDEELAPYILMVREIAYGWPGGVEPGTAEESE